MPKKKEQTKEVTYVVDFHTPEFMPSKVATNIVIQMFNEVFKMSLFELKPDIILSEEDRKRMESRGTVRADCIGSFIINPANLRTFVKLINEQLAKYDKHKKLSTKPNSNVPPGSSSTSF